MVSLGIATDDKEVWFGTPKNVGQHPNTKFCIEQVSQEMFEALLDLAGDPAHNPTISQLLYIVLASKGLSNN